MKVQIAPAPLCHRSLHAPRVEWIRRELEEDARSVGAAAHRRDEGHLVAVGDAVVPIHELLVERNAHRGAVGLQSGMVPPQRLVYVGQRRARGNLESLGFRPCLFSQPRKEPHFDGDRYGHCLNLLAR